MVDWGLGIADWGMWIGVCGADFPVGHAARLPTVSLRDEYGQCHIDGNRYDIVHRRDQRSRSDRRVNTQSPEGKRQHDTEDRSHKNRRGHRQSDRNGQASLIGYRVRVRTERFEHREADRDQQPRA